MTNLELLSKTKVQKIGKVPVVVLPLEIWQEIEERLEEADVLKLPGFWEAIKKERALYRSGKFIDYENFRKKLKL
jgi:hypothetical protein